MACRYSIIDAYRIASHTLDTNKSSITASLPLFKPTVAILRPDDKRITEVIQDLPSLGDTSVDPMLSIHPTGETPEQADYCVFTTNTGVELAARQNWETVNATVRSIGQ